MKVYVVYGGPSSEYEVSVNSKELFLELLESYAPIAVEWGKDFDFRVPGIKTKMSLDAFLTLLKQDDGVFVNAMHGEYCEDGWIQEKLEAMKIPFTGPSSKAARQTMDKVAAQEMVKDLIRIIPTQVLTIPVSPDAPPLVLKDDMFPIFLKPRSKGSSVGIHKIHTKSEYDAIVAELEAGDYLVQPAIVGMEISIGTVFDKGTYLPLPATEIIPNSEFFDYKAKYTQGGSKEITPARISDALMKELQRKSISIHERLGLGCYSRTDMIITADQEVIFIETNALPGMTRTSLVPQQLRAIGKLEEFGEILLRNLAH